MRASTLCLLTTLIAAAGPVAAAAAASVADCHAASGESVLVSTSIPAIDARAVWLDARAVLWPQKSASSRFAIHHASNGGILTESGASATGADLRLPLKAAPKAQAGPPHYLGAGATLVLSEAGRTRLPTLLRGEVVLVEEDAAGQVLDATRIQPAGALDALFAAAAEPLDFGAKVHRDRPGGPQTDFRVWAPTAQGVALCLYPDATRAADTVLPLTRDPASGAWHTGVPGDLSARAAAYTYLVDVFVPGRGLVRNRVTDPYALSLTTDSARSVVIDLDAPDLAPAGWAQDARPTRVRAPTDLVIYELHVRDFSASDLTVPAEHRGKYLAFTDTGSDGMQHLARLAQAGITDVHLLPIFDLATVPETGCVTPRPEGAPDGETQQATVEAVKAVDCFNWGYDPWHFTAPEGSYATDPADGRVRILELRRMVQTLHRLGLRVGMDVVYNHTTASGQHPRSVLDRIVPGYYQRLDARGQVERSTCCDNTATEHRMMAKLMIDSTVVWARDHRIDSFRFDLMGHQPRDAMLRLQRAVDAAAGRHIHLIGEGWNFGEVADGRRFVQASQLSLNGSGIATFSDRARDAVRGGGAGDNGPDQIARQGWINGLFLDPNPASQGRATRDDLLRATDLVRVGLAGSLRGYVLHTHDGRRRALADIDYGGGQPAGYVSQPGEVVNYVENHDNATLFDANAFKLPPDTPREDRARVQVLGAATVALSQGIAYFHAGQEILRSKSMDRNSYDSGDWFNRIDWTLQDNGFGRGLPPRQDNADSWPLMRPRLADPAFKPTPAEIRWTRDAFLDLLRIRASTSLLRLRRADDVKTRLRFHNTGPEQVAGVIVGAIDGRGYPGARFRELVYVINAARSAQRIALPALRGHPLGLHPVHRAPGAADRRAAEASFDAERGEFRVPGRTAVVFVR